MNSIICGDSAKVLAGFPDDFIDLTVTSPPYDNLREYNGYEFDFEAIAQQLYRVTKPGGVVVWVVGDATINGSETGTSFRQALYFMECGFNLYDTMIWFTADHGENMVDHEINFSHGDNLYHSLVHVPLFLKLSNQYGSMVVDEPVRSIDI